MTFSKNNLIKIFITITMVPVRVTTMLLPFSFKTSVISESLGQFRPEVILLEGRQRSVLAFYDSFQVNTSSLNVFPSKNICGSRFG